MTDEQIRQNAEAFAIKICEETPIDYRVVSDAYFAGAHSRDEEIKELEQALAATEDVLDVQSEKLDKLRNPWISVEERLPENNVEVIGNTEIGWKFLVKRNCGVWCGMEYKAHTSPKITHWMYIPKAPTL